MNSVHWLVALDPIWDFNPHPPIETIASSDLASTRLRLGTLLKSNNLKQLEVTFGSSIKNNPAMIMIGKPSFLAGDILEDLWLSQTIKNKTNGSKIILDYTDDHLNNISSTSNFYYQYLPYIDAAVTSSLYLKKALQKHFQGHIEIITDPIEVPISKPHCKTNETVNILWFGHASNIDYLKDIVSQWKDLKTKLILNILTNEDGMIIFKKNQPSIPKNLSINIMRWSRDAMINTAKFCNLCIIPSNPNDLKKAGVSSNRLITALALGLPTAADNLNSYNEFKDYFIDIRSEAFDLLLNHPNNYNHLVTKAQQRIIPNFTQDKIGLEWVKFFSSLKCN
jgi:hypothetical protein